MKKNVIIIISIIVVLILGIILIRYFNYNAIKKEDIFDNVSFKENIPDIRHKREGGISIKDSLDNIILISYKYNKENDCYLVGLSKSESDNLYYYYSFEDIYADETLVYKKGWNSVDKETYKTTPLSGCPIESISGTVFYTTGDTSLIKKCLQGI